MSMNHRTLCNAICCALSVGAFAAATVTTPALAQTTSSAKKEKTLQTVQVLGTRIRGAQMAGMTPVLKVTAQQIKNTGLATVGQVLQKLAVTGSSINTTNDNSGNFGAPPNGAGIGAGATTISLRNLGATRTLVLVDGLRWVNGSSASGVGGAVDLNTIPASIIQSIQVLKSGASALYGSDAIGGVINIITKRTQQGAAVNAYYGDYSGHGGITRTGDLSFGDTVGKFSFYVDAMHFKQTGIGSDQWARSDTAVIDGIRDNLSSHSVPARVDFTAPVGFSDNKLCPGNVCEITAKTPNGGTEFPNGFKPFTLDDWYDYGPFNNLLTPSRRTGLFANVHYRISNSVTLYFRGLYNSRKSSSHAAPAQIVLGSCQAGTICQDMTISSTNPYNPFGFTLRPSDPNMLVARRIVEAGERVFKQTVDTKYFATGLNGDFGIGERNYHWDFNLVRSDNDASQVGNGNFNDLHILNALGPLSTCQALTFCVPLDLFGDAGTLTPKMLKYISYQAHSSSHQYLGIVSGDISGDVMKLPAGWMEFAAGLGRRNLSGSFQPDPLSVDGDAGGPPILPTAGGFHVTSAYLELNVPILKDVFLAKNLNVDLASRYSDYSTFAGTTNSRIGIRWEVSKQFTARGNWSQGFRAPTIGELFGSLNGFAAQLTDPCNFDSSLASPMVAANCKALGVPNPSTFHQANSQINTQTGGNANLQPERSRSWSGGVVYSPSWARGTGWSQSLDMGLTYYHISLKNAIEAPAAQTIMNECALTLNPAFCSHVQRSAGGFVTVVNDTLENLGRIDTDGLDISLNWIGPTISVGRFSAHLNGTYVNHFQSKNQLTGTLQPLMAGTEAGGSSAIPRWKSTLRFGWTYRQWRALWTIRYISAVKEDCGAFSKSTFYCTGLSSAPFYVDGSHRMGATVYNNVQASYSFDTHIPVTITAGANNVFARTPPMCLSCSLNNYDMDTYDIPFRFWYASVGVKF